MSIINQIITNYIEFFKRIKELNISFTFIIPLGIALWYVGKPVYRRFQYRLIQEKLRIRVDKKGNLMDKIKGLILKNQKAKKIVDYVAGKIMIMNDFSLDQNRNYSIIAIFILALLLILGFIFLYPRQIIWYEQLLYLLIFISTLFIGVGILFSYMKNLFLNKLPETYKLLNSRFITTGKIKDAIKISLPDFDKPVKREMTRIIDALNLNSTEKIEETFQQIDATYRDDFFSILLELIKKAHFQGDADVVKEQFEELTDEILDEIENQKNLMATSRFTIAVTLISTPALMNIFEYFSRLGLGSSADAFFTSPNGILIKYGIYISALVVSGYIFYLEKSA